MKQSWLLNPLLCRGFCISAASNDAELKRDKAVTKHKDGFEKKIILVCASLVMLFVSQNSVAGFLDGLKRQAEQSMKEMADGVVGGLSGDKPAQDRQDSGSVPAGKTVQPDTPVANETGEKYVVKNANYPWELFSPAMHFKDIDKILIRSGYEPDPRNDVQTCPKRRCVLVYTGVMSDEIDTRIRVRVLRGDINKIKIESIYPKEKGYKAMTMLKNRIPPELKKKSYCKVVDKQIYGYEMINCGGIRDADVSGIKTRKTHKGTRENNFMHSIMADDQRSDGNVHIRITYGY